MDINDLEEPLLQQINVNNELQDTIQTTIKINEKADVEMASK